MPAGALRVERSFGGSSVGCVTPIWGMSNKVQSRRGSERYWPYRFPVNYS